MSQSDNPDEAVTGDLSAVLDCLRFDLLQAVLDMLRGELSLRRIGLEQRIGTEAPPAVFVAPRLKFRTSQVIEQRQDQSWLVRFLRGPSPNRYAALRIRAELAAMTSEPPDDEDLQFRVRHPSFINSEDVGTAMITLATGQRLAVSKLTNQQGIRDWQLDSLPPLKGLPMEGVALLVETIIRWREERGDRDLRTIPGSALAGSGRSIGELLNVFASGISDVGSMLHSAHHADALRQIPEPNSSMGEPLRRRVERLNSAYNDLVGELRRIGETWHSELGSRFQFHRWRARLLLDVDQDLVPTPRGTDDGRLQVDFEAVRESRGPILLSYSLPDVLSEGEFLRSVSASVVASIERIVDLPGDDDAGRAARSMLGEITRHIDAGRVRLVRIKIGGNESEGGEAGDTDLLIVKRDVGQGKIRQIFLLLELRIDRFPSVSLRSVENIRFLGYSRIEDGGLDNYRLMKGGRPKFSNFRKIDINPPGRFGHKDEVHRHFARLINVMHGWQVLIDGLQETQA